MILKTQVKQKARWNIILTCFFHTNIRKTQIYSTNLNTGRFKCREQENGVTPNPTNNTIDFTVEKQWINGSESQLDIQEQLYRNGSAYGEPIILQNGVTTYTWTDLNEKDTNVTPCVYTVDEFAYPKSIERLLMAI